jgi:Mn-containing catalase
MNLLEEVLVEQLQDILHAEKQLVKALPRMARAARNPELKRAFQRHTEQTQGQVERLEKVFESLGQKVKAKPCKGMQGLVTEGQEIIAEGKQKDEIAADLALAAAAQKVEHYEIASYGTVRALANSIGNQKVEKLLSQTLAEEEATDKLLTELSQPLLSQALEQPSEEEEE